MSLLSSGTIRARTPFREGFMHLLVEANTDRGRRRFIIGSDSGREAEALMRTFLDVDDRIMDESGEWFEASEIDVEIGATQREARAARVPVDSARL
jgi:hypothetical protein